MAALGADARSISAQAWHCGVGHGTRMPHHLVVRVSFAKLRCFDKAGCDCEERTPARGGSEGWEVRHHLFALAPPLHHPRSHILGGLERALGPVWMTTHSVVGYVEGGGGGSNSGAFRCGGGTAWRLCCCSPHLRTRARADVAACRSVGGKRVWKPAAHSPTRQQAVFGTV
jgi:hypothetical protein